MTLWTAITWGLLILAAAIGAWAVLSDSARGRLRCPGGWRRLLWVLPWRQGCWYDMSGVVGGLAGDVARGGGPASTLAAAEGPGSGDSAGSVGARAGGRVGEPGVEGAVFPVTCPECGRSVRRAGQLRRRRVRYRALAMVLPVLLGAHVASVMPRVEKHGWLAGVPTWALAATAPMDDFARGALGCRFSWNTMSAATRELAFPKWERRYASWETAIIKWRAERAVERVRGEFPGRDAVFIPLAKYESEEWWGWEGERFGERERAGWVRAVSEWARGLRIGDESQVHLSRLGVVCGMLAVGSTLDRARSFAESLALVDRVGEGETLSGEVRESSAGRRWSVCIYNVTDFGPRALERAWWVDYPAIRAHEQEHGRSSVVESREITELRRIVTRACEGEYRSHVVRDGENWSLTRVVSIGRSLVVRDLLDTQDSVARLLAAIRECERTGTDVEDEILLPTVWQTARVHAAIQEASPQGRESASGLDSSSQRIRTAMRAASTMGDGDVMGVGRTIVTFGSEEAQAAAVAEIRRLREEAAARAGGGP